MEKKEEPILPEKDQKTVKTAVEQLANIFVAFIDEQNSKKE